jgi:hypothetical protein
MNWEKGFYRIWAVVSFIWLLVFAALAYGGGNNFQEIWAFVISKPIVVHGYKLVPVDYDPFQKTPSLKPEVMPLKPWEIFRAQQETDKFGLPISPNVSDAELAEIVKQLPENPFSRFEPDDAVKVDFRRQEISNALQEYALVSDFRRSAFYNTVRQFIFAILVPIALLIAGLAVAWIARGFSTRKQGN